MLKMCQKGSTMIEMIGVIGIIAMITVGLFATVSKVFDRYLQTTVVAQIRDLQKNIQSRYAAAADYRDLSKSDIIPTLINERVIPYGMVSGNKVYHAYKGEVTFSGTQYEYTITFSNLKKAGCVDLVTINWAVSNTSDLVKLKFGGKTYTWTGKNSTLLLPVSIMDAAQYCHSDPAQNVIEWTFQ